MGAAGGVVIISVIACNHVRKGAWEGAFLHIGAESGRTGGTTLQAGTFAIHLICQSLEEGRNLFDEADKNRNKKALIIGGGIGGLAAARALHMQGWECCVCEKADSRTGAGAGIVLAANAMKALDRLGAGDAVRAQGSPVRQGLIRTWDGKRITRLPVEEQARRFGSESWMIHRADLHAVLIALLPVDTIIYGRRLVRFEQTEWNVTAHFENGETATGALLIGADGLHSTVRRALFGHTPLRYAGFTAFRGICRFPEARIAGDVGEGFEAWGPGVRFGATPIGRGDIFWFAAVNAPEGFTVPPGRRKPAVLAHLRGWASPVEALVEATDETAVLSHDVFDRTTLPRWSEGRVTLLGDAAHPMLPNLGQGGAQAMEDALVLARALAEADPDVPQALTAYERSRLPRTTRVVRDSRRMGRLVQLEHPAAIAIRNRILRAMPPGLQLQRLDWLIGHDVFH
ncbi:FAD-dependent monooxygenase [Paenibacillus validus]|uniref:FAD-dependent monooxygenase n=1 Tax=Paenibacillus validus TaxID=44253 RepID=UPI0027D9B823|nr:FAD-dependent monooxygenase [Paenibacillus validus]